MYFVQILSSWAVTLAPSGPSSGTSFTTVHLMLTQ